MSEDDAAPTTDAAAPADGGAARGKKAAKRAHNSAGGGTEVEAAPDAAAASLPSKGGRKLEKIPVAALRAAEGANGATDTDGVLRFRNKEKVLMLTSRGIPPR